MLPCLLASPTLLRIGPTPYLARPLTLHGFGVLLRNGADALGMDGDGGDLPEFGSDAFQAWLEGPGSMLLAWECLRRDNPVTLAQCEAIGVQGARELLGAALRRARTAATRLPAVSRGWAASSSRTRGR